MTLLLGLIFAGVGAWLPLQARLDASITQRVVLLAIALVFFLPGLGATATGVRRIWRGLVRHHSRLRPAAGAWAADYPWPRGRYSRSSGGPAMSFWSLFILYFLTLFTLAAAALGIFILVDADDWEGRFVGLGFMLLCGLAISMFRTIFSKTWRDLWHWPRFGRTRVRFERLPLPRGQTATLTWMPPDLGVCQRLSFVLRHVREVHERQFVGPKTSDIISVPFEHWHGHIEHETPEPIMRGQAVLLQVEVPADAPGTAMAHRPPAYWELEVRAQRRDGIDFRARYLVPIY